VRACTRRTRKGSKKAKAGGFGALSVRSRCVPVAASDEGARNAESMGLHQPLFAALRRKGYRLPTPVQRKTIPLILAGAFTVS
jgi:hypothetical protein